MVAQHAVKIHNLLEETSEWDKIDHLLSGLEKAKVLDGHLDGEVETRILPLRALRQQRESNVDSGLSEMIESGNFQGIGQFLTPLAKSKDQLMKQKFDIHPKIR